MTAEAQVATARKMLHDISSDAQWTIRLQAMFDRCAREPDIINAMSHVEEQAGFLCVRDSLHMSLIMALNRIHDLHDGNASNLRNLIRIVSLNEVKQHLLNEADAQAEAFVPPSIGGHLIDSRPIAEIRSAMATTRKARIHEVLVAAIHSYEELKASNLILPWREVRDKMLAHHSRAEMKKTARYGDEREILIRTVPIIDNLHIALRGVPRSLTRDFRNWKRWANIFWVHVAQPAKSKGNN